MTTINKTKRTSSPLIKKLLAEASPIQRIQNKNRVALACRIDDLIKAKGYTNSSFASKMGKQPSEITKWLSGSHNFTMNTLDEIAYNLVVETAFLMQPQPEKVIFKKQVVMVTKIVEVGFPPYPPYESANFSNVHSQNHHYSFINANV